MCVGSTSIGALARENIRRARIKQSQAGQYVQVELANRVRTKELSYQHFSTVVISVRYRDSWIQEHVLIDCGNPG